MIPSIREWILNVGLKKALLGLWLVISGLVFWRTYHTFKTDPQFYYVHQLLGSWLCISRGSAAVLNLNCAALLLPMCHTLAGIVRALGRKFGTWSARHVLDGRKTFHIMCAYIVILLSCLHVVAHIFNIFHFSTRHNTEALGVNPVNDQTQNKPLRIIFSVPGITGMFMFLIIVFMASSSLRCIRDRNFNVFWYSHRLFAVFYMILFIHGFRGPIRRQTNVDEHYPGCNSTGNMSIPVPEPDLFTIAQETDDVISQKCDKEPVFDHNALEAWKWLCLPLLLYLTDLLYRLYQRQTPASLVAVNQLSSDVIQITLEKQNFVAKPGQYVLVQFPCISTTEWHPFSVVATEARAAPFLEVWIKDSGDWSGKVIRELTGESTLRGNSQLPVAKCTNHTMEVNVDGPFTSPLEEVSKFRVAFCVAGGIGVTPFISHLDHIRQQVGDGRSSKLQRLLFLFIAREWSLIEACSLKVKDTWETVRHYISKVQKVDANMLSARFYYTGDTPPKTNLSQGDASFLQQRLYYGRPNLSEIFDDISLQHRGERIGVFTCGPVQLNNDVKRHCFKQSKSTLYFHKETF